MAGAFWNLLQIAVILFFEILKCHHNDICTFLFRIAESKRSLTAVRSKLAELRQNPSLYNASQRLWTKKAKKISFSKCLSVDSGFN